LYGQTGKYGARGASRKSEIHSQTGIFSKEGQSKGPRWGEDISAAQRRQDFLRTTGFGDPEAPDAPSPSTPIPDDTEINIARSQLRMPKVVKGSELESRSLHADNFYQKYNVVKDHQEINVISLVFNNLPPTMDIETLKIMSGAKHVVRCIVQTDNIKNECTGEGEITIRLFGSETKEEIVARFYAAGLNTQDKKEDAGQRKSNFHELASNGYRDQRQVNTAYETDKLAKLANLSTNVHMGTNEDLVNMNRNHAEVIRNNQIGIFKAQNDVVNQNNQLQNWDNMRPQTAGPSYSNSSGNESFMRPTQSFNTRTKLTQNSYKTQYF